MMNAACVVSVVLGVCVSSAMTQGTVRFRDDDEVLGQELVHHYAGVWEFEQRLGGEAVDPQESQGPPTSTAFSFTNHLTRVGAPETGITFFLFLLYDDETAPLFGFTDLQFGNAKVTDGWFTFPMDFGPGLFGGQNPTQAGFGRTQKQRWMQMLVQYEDQVIEVFPDRIPVSPATFSMRSLDTDRIRGRLVDDGAPSDGDLLTWDALDGQWKPVVHDRYTDAEAKAAVGPVGGLSGHEIVTVVVSGLAAGGNLIPNEDAPQFDDPGLAPCPPGKVVLGGGGRILSIGNTNLPAINISALFPLVESRPEGNAWRVRWASNLFQIFEYEVEVYCICADAD